MEIYLLSFVVFALAFAGLAVGLAALINARSSP